MVFNSVLDVQFSLESTTEPLTSNEIKNWLRLSSDVDLALAETTAKSARILLEKFTNTSFISRKVTATICNLQGDILLPYCPYVSGLIVRDIDGNVQIDVKKFGNEFVNLRTPKADILVVEYMAGFSVLPHIYKDAIKQQLAYMWENRGDESIGMHNIARKTLAHIRKVI